MDNRVSEFLRSRRARITPEQAGIITGGRRRVPGLRREEVAMLAGTSIDAKIERGNLAGVSAEILDAIARALRLDASETEHLLDLAHSAAPTPARRRRTTPADTAVRPSLQRFLDTITGTPTWVRNRHMDIVATNPLAAALLSPVLADPATRANNARFTFFDPAARTYYPDWDQGASSIVATLRSAAGRHPHDTNLTGLIGELVTRSDEFRHRWATHDERFHRTEPNASSTPTSATSPAPTRRSTSPTAQVGPRTPAPSNPRPPPPTASPCSAASPPHPRPPDPRRKDFHLAPATAASSPFLPHPVAAARARPGRSESDARRRQGRQIPPGVLAYPPSYMAR